MQLSITLPQQRKTYAEKKKDKFKWAKDCIDAVSLAMYQYNIDGENYHTDVQRKLTNYKLYNNVLDQSDFEKDCNPFGLTAEQFKDTIQPYNKLYNKINVLLGEELKRPFNLRTYLVNDQAVNAYTRAKNELQRQYIKHTLDSELAKYKEKIAQEFGDPQSEEEAQQMQQELQAQADKIISPEQIEKYMTTEWRDGAEIMMDQILQWFNKKLRIRKKKNDGFKHSLISGEEHAWVGIVNGEPVVELLNPIKLIYHKSSEIEYVQDGAYAGYRTRMTVADVLDRYSEDMTESDKDKIDSMQAMSNMYGITDNFIDKEIKLEGLNKSLEWRMLRGQGGVSMNGSYGVSTLNDVDVVHVEWRSQRKFGFLTYFDESGEEQEMLVDETFVVPDSASKVKYNDKYGNKKTKYVWIKQDSPFELEWTWLPEVWEGTRIAGDIYVNVRPKPYQSRSLYNPYKVKLGYHGLVYNAMNAPNVSLMDRGKPFLYLYLITMHKMKEIMAKDMPPLSMIDMSMIPKTLSNEQWLYYYKQGLGFYDPNQNNEGNPQNISGQKGPAFEVQRSAMQHVNNYIEILAYLDNQISEVMGVSKEREGGASAQAAVTNSQQNITQSTHITEILFQAHNSLWEQIMTSLVETAQICYKDNPKKIPIVLDDMSRAIINLQTDENSDYEFGVFITDDPNDAQNLTDLRQMAMNFAQNGGTISDIAKLYRATSMEALEREFRSLEESRSRMQQAQEQATLESNERIAQANIEAQDRQHQYVLEQIDRKGEWDIRKAELTALGMDEGDDSSSILEEAKLALEHDKLNADLQDRAAERSANQYNDDKRMMHEKEMQDKELKDNEKERQNKIKVAKAKPKPKPAKK